MKIMEIDGAKFKVGDKELNTKEEFLLEFLRATKQMMSSNPHAVRFYDLILSKGQLFKGRDLSNNFELIKKLPFKPKVKECYYNSQMLALEGNGNIKYFEGYAFDDLLPVEHAWCIIDNKVVDLTWEVKDKMFKKDYSKETVYFGIEIPIAFIRKHILKTGMSEALLWQIWETL
jgi:hypothetical protein